MSEKPQHTEPAPGKSKRSSVYVYLAVLFAAAFLMLLLAYFVQQRNNESTISGLQNSWNLSREGLMAENKELRQEIEALEGQIEDLRNQQAKLDKQLADARQKASDYEAMYDSRTNDLQRELVRADALANLWTTDHLYRTGRYKDCAGSLVNFNAEIISILPTEALDRALEISRSLTGRGLLDGELVTLLEYYMAAQDASQEG